MRQPNIEVRVTRCLRKRLHFGSRLNPLPRCDAGLPVGGVIPEDYVFERIGQHLRPEKVPMSRLFELHNTLILYSFTYGPERDSPCPMCTHLLDSVNGAASHVRQRAALYVVAKSPIARLVAWARARGWAHLNFLSLVAISLWCALLTC